VERKGAWASGDRHEGEFRNHGILGEGLRTETDGTTLRGTFRGADLDGRGMVTRPDGSRTVGLWKGGKLQRGARAD
jgi:hypothetical protein